MSSDQFSVRAVVVGLIAVLFLLAAGMVYLATTGTTIPDPVDRLAFLVAGAVAGLLSKTSTNDAPQQVQIMNEEDDAVPVEDAAPKK